MALQFDKTSQRVIAVTVDGTTGEAVVPNSTMGLLQVANMVYDSSLLDWVPETQPGGGGGGGVVTQGTVPWVTDDEQYAYNLDATTSPILYFGQAEPGSLTSAAVWRIQQIDITAGAIGLWAGGAPAFSYIFDDRASLSYS